MTRKRREKRDRRRRLVRLGKAGTRGPVSKVTASMIARVGKRYALGLPLLYALSMEEEEIPLPTFHDAVKEGAKLHTRWLRQKAMFLLRACDKLAETKYPLPDLRWLLTRRHPDIFATPEERGEGKAGNAEVVEDGLQKLLNRVRERRRQKQSESENQSD